MKVGIKYYITLIISVIFSIGVFGTETKDSIRYGLAFNAIEKQKDLRTSFSVDDIEVDDYFRLDFDWNLNSPLFGYICRIVVNDTLNIDLVLNYSNGHGVEDGISLSVVSDNRKLYSREVDLEGGWDRTSITILPENSSVIVGYGDDVKEFSFDFTPKQNNISIYFGSNDTPNFMTSDVASVFVRDIAISLDSQSEEWRWKLDGHIDNIAYDIINHRELAIDNANWLIDAHASWRHLLRKRYPSSSYIAPNSKDGFYAITDSVIYFTRYDNLHEESYTIKEPTSFVHSYNQFIVNPATGELIFFAVEDDMQYQYSKFNFQENEWQPNISFDKAPFYRHSNMAFSPCDGSLTQLFGYGYFSYHAKQYTIGDHGIDYRELSEMISPRYLSATGVLDNDLYIFGGYGNKGGNQELGATIYGDMYRYNFVTKEIRSLWDNSCMKCGELIAKNIVFPDRSSNRAYALFYSHLKYNTFLVLKEMDIENFTFTQHADTLPYRFHDTESEAHLVYSDFLKELYAITTHTTSTGMCELNIYSIAYPVIDSETIVAQLPAKSSGASFLWLLLILPPVFVIYIQRKRIGSSPVKPKAVLPSEVIVQPEVIAQPEVVVAPIEKNSKPGIYLLGGFQVIDRQGVDITGSFTTLMKQLLLLIILETQKSSKGISSARLKDYLWFDKSDGSARNNRGVNLRKIRLLLEECAYFSIVSDGGYWRISLENSAYCDYIYATQYLSTIDQDAPLCGDRLAFLVEIAQMGLLLPNMDADFFDNFKADYTDRMIELLSNQLSIQDDWNSKKLLSDAILIFDSLDESAIKVKFQYFIATGRHGMARTAYDNYAKEYQKIMGSDPENSFEDFIKG